jgi:hypothetical protein
MSMEPSADQQQSPAWLSRGGVERAFNLDLTRPWAFAILALAFVASRVPWIDNGFGTKPDAWRIALSGYWLWDKHEFYPSRLPGYPIPEFSYALVIKGGWLATNSLTIAISLLGLWFFANIVREVRLPSPALIVVGFAFQPLLWINSMNTMDYAWALTFILGTYYFLLRGNIFVAGLVMGLAVASRIPSSAFLVPYCIYIWRSGRRSEIRSFIVSVVAVAIVAFSPIMWTYGTSFLNFYDASIGYRDVVRLVAKDAFGLAGTMALGIGILVSLPRFVKLPRDAMRDKDVMVWTLAVVLIAFVFLRLPHEAAYLIPLFPFGFLLIGRYFRTGVLACVIAVMLVAGFVDFTTTNHQVGLSSVRHLRVGQGMLLSNRNTMRSQLAYTHRIERMDVPANSTVIIGFSYPQFAVLNRDRLELGLLRKDKSSISQLTDMGKAVDTQRRITYVWLYDYADFTKLPAGPIYYTLDAGRSTLALYKFRPGLLGMPPHEVHLIDFGITPSGEQDTAGGGRQER